MIFYSSTWASKFGTVSRWTWSRYCCHILSRRSSSHIGKPFQSVSPDISVLEIPRVPLTPTRLLHSTLTDLYSTTTSEYALPPFDLFQLEFGYHQVLCNAEVPVSKLLSDGTEIHHLPLDLRLEIERGNDALIPRRMLTGGSVWYAPDTSRDFRPEREKPVVCLEAVVHSSHRHSTSLGTDVWRQYGFKEHMLADCSLKIPKIWERRTLAFLPHPGTQRFSPTEIGMVSQHASAARSKRKPLSTTAKCHSKTTILPTLLHLFNFSALTFNAHRIHYDSAYAELEGYRAPIIHGLLTSLLMANYIRLPENGQTAHQLSDTNKAQLPSRQPLTVSPEVVRAIEYRNFAPLYCNEPMTLCASWRYGRVLAGNIHYGKHLVWIEGSDGRLAARANVYTSIGPEFPLEARLRKDLTNEEAFRSID